MFSAAVKIDMDGFTEKGTVKGKTIAALRKNVSAWVEDVTLGFGVGARDWYPAPVKKGNKVVGTMSVNTRVWVVGKVSEQELTD